MSEEPKLESMKRLETTEVSERVGANDLKLSRLQNVRHRTISIIDEDELQVYKLYRERIVQEDSLVNNRMTWMILSQAFLFAFWAALHQQFISDLQSSQLLFYFISTVGINFALGSWFSLHAARGEIRELKNDFLDFYRRPGKGRRRHKKPELKRVDELRDDILPRLTGAAHFHWLGHTVPFVMPIVIILLWVALDAVVFRQTHPQQMDTSKNSGV